MGIIGAIKVPDERVNCAKGINNMKSRKRRIPIPLSALPKLLTPILNIPPTDTGSLRLAHEKQAASAVSSTNAKKPAQKSTRTINISVIGLFR